MVTIIGVMGNVASGKTTLAKRLGSVCGFDFIEEIVDENIYLELFYQDPQTWGFQSKMWFLQYRFRNYLEARGKTGTIIVDGTIWDDLAHAYASLSGHNLNLYMDWYNLVKPFAICDVVIYLTAPLDVLFSRIQTRNRKAEISTDEDELRLYLQKLERAYQESLTQVEAKFIWELNTYELDLVSSEEDLKPLIEKIKGFV